MINEQGNSPRELLILDEIKLLEQILAEMPAIDFSFITTDLDQKQARKITDSRGQALPKYASIFTGKDGSKKLREPNWEPLEKLTNQLKQAKLILHKLFSVQRLAIDISSPQRELGLKLVQKLIASGVPSIDYLRDVRNEDIGKHMRMAHQEIIDILTDCAHELTVPEVELVVNSLLDNQDLNQDSLINLTDFVARADRVLSQKVASNLLEKLLKVVNWKPAQIDLLVQFLNSSKPFLPFDDNSLLSQQKKLLLDKLSSLN